MMQSKIFGSFFFVYWDHKKFRTNVKFQLTNGQLMDVISTFIMKNQIKLCDNSSTSSAWWKWKSAFCLILWHRVEKVADRFFYWMSEQFGHVHIGYEDYFVPAKYDAYTLDGMIFNIHTNRCMMYVYYSWKCSQYIIFIWIKYKQKVMNFDSWINCYQILIYLNTTIFMLYYVSVHDWDKSI